MSKTLYTLLSLFACSPAVFAGPSTSSMAQNDAPPARVADVATPAIVPATDATTERLEYRAASLADSADVGPADPHPMIPLPPALWAGFAGLAYVARRVTSRRS